jgi:GNAT superfamily N-acetyltransferase
MPGSATPGPRPRPAGAPVGWDTAPVETVTLRSAEPADVVRLIELIGLGAVDGPPAVTPDPAPYREALAEIRSAARGDVLVAERDGEVVGLCQLVVFRHLQHDGGLCGEIESLHVHPDHRSSGIGGQLLEAAVATARRAGCYRVQLTSNLCRTEAHRFYDRHGFEPSHVGFKRQLD